MSPISVHRVYWYTDYLDGVKWALRELWRALFGCRHDWHTIRHLHVQHPWGPGEHARLWVNTCSKCGDTRTHAHWTRYPWADRLEAS